MAASSLALLLFPRAPTITALSNPRRLGFSSHILVAPTTTVRRAWAASSSSSSRGYRSSTSHRLGAGFRPEPQTLNWKPVGPDEDVFISALSQNGQVGVKVVSAKHMVESTMKKQGLSDTAGDLMGRVMLSTMLVAHGIKDEETLQVTFNGNGNAKGVLAIADGSCNVRAWIGNRGVEGDIKSAVGQGTVQVVKSHPSWVLPYNGVVEIVSGEVAPDMAYYLATSEQRNTAIGVGLSIDQHQVIKAGGFYVEMLPGAEEGSIVMVEANLQALLDRAGSLDPSVLLKELSPYDLVESLLDGLGIGVAQEKHPAYKCTCNRDKVFRAVGLLGKEDTDDLLASKKGASATCEFCGESYTISHDELADYMATKKG